MEAPEFLLPALIPHAVLNRDVALYISGKGWVIVAPRGGDPKNTATATKTMTLAERQSKTAISLRPWHDEADASPFIAARLTSLQSEISSFEPELFNRMWAANALRIFLDGAENYEDALAVAEATFAERVSQFCLPTGDQGRVLPLIHDAVAWLRAAPARRPIDLPRFNASSLGYVPKLLTETPTVDTILRVLAQQASIVSLSLPLTVLDPLIIRIRTAIVEGHPDRERLVEIAERITSFTGDHICHEHLVSSRLFPNLRSVVLGHGVGSPAVWGAVASLRCVNEVSVVSLVSGGGADDLSDGDRNRLREKQGAAMTRAFSAIGPDLRTLSIRFTLQRRHTDTVSVPMILAQAQPHCKLLQELTLQQVVLPSDKEIEDFFGCIAHFARLRTLVLEHVNHRLGGYTDAGPEASAFLTKLPVLETLEMRHIGCSIRHPLFMEALAASAALTHLQLRHLDFGEEFAAVEILGRSPESPVRALTTLAPFPRLSSAATSYVTAIVIAREARHLRFLSPLENEICDLKSFTFASPNVHLSIGSRSDVECTGPWPSSVRHLTLHAPAWDRQSKDVRLLDTAATHLESLTLTSPPPSQPLIDAVCRCRRLSRLTLTKCGDLWMEAVERLGSVCDDVVLERLDDEEYLP